MSLQDVPRIGHGCHGTADRGAVVLETHVHIMLSVSSAHISSFTAGTQIVLTWEL